MKYDVAVLHRTNCSDLFTTKKLCKCFSVKRFLRLRSCPKPFPRMLKKYLGAINKLCYVMGSQRRGGCLSKREEAVKQKNEEQFIMVKSCVRLFVNGPLLVAKWDLVAQWHLVAQWECLGIAISQFSSKFIIFGNQFIVVNTRELDSNNNVVSFYRSGQCCPLCCLSFCYCQIKSFVVFLDCLET